MKKGLGLLLVACLVLTLAGCGVTNTPEKVPSTNGSGEDETAQKQETFSIGDKVKMGDFYITVKKAYFYEGSKWNKPGDGVKWLVLDIELENHTNDPQNVSSLLMFDLYDSDNYSCDIAINTDEKGSINGELGPGRKMAGEITFKVPNDKSSFELIFEPEPFAKGQAVFEITGIE